MPHPRTQQSGAPPAARHPPGHLARACERESGEFTIWQCDRISIIRAQHATGVHHDQALRASRAATAPTHRQHPPRRAIQPRLLSHLTAARSVRGLLTLHRAARQIPGAAVHRICQQPLLATPVSNAPAVMRLRASDATYSPAGNTPGRPAPACQALPARSAVRQENATGAHAAKARGCPPSTARAHGRDAMGVQVGSMGVQLGPEGRSGDQPAAADRQWDLTRARPFAGQAAPGTRSLTPREHRALPGMAMGSYMRKNATRDVDYAPAPVAVRQNQLDTHGHSPAIVAA
jgi:hypothetical protein